MAVAAVTVHLKAGFFLPNGVEYVLALFLASIALSLTGSGAFSIDRLLETRAPARSSPTTERTYPQDADVR
jgi:putative oxidoreductase